MNIESLIAYVVKTPIRTRSWDNTLFLSFYDQIFIRQQALTIKQANLVLRLLSRYQKQLSQSLNQDISVFLQSPTYKIQPKKLTAMRRIHVDTAPDLIKVFKVEFPYDENIIVRIRNQKERHFNYVTWYDKEKCWVLALNEKNLIFLQALKQEYGFETDEAFDSLAEASKLILETSENHVPMLILENGQPKIKNFPVTMDLNISSNLKDALFQSRKLGVTVWDAEIEDILTKGNFDPITVQLLKTVPGDHLEIHGDTRNLGPLTEIVKQLTPCLWVIPGNDELEKTQNTVNFLESLGYTTDQISVLFRFNNDKNPQFNNYVKERGLNKPITENTRAVLISQRFPKTILQSGIKFGAVICFGSAIVHYLIKDYLNSHANVVYYIPKTNQGILNFGKM